MMNSEPNPYEATETLQDEHVSAPAANVSLGRLLASLVGFFVCGVGAVVVGELMSFIALIPPISRLTHLDGEFHGLILIGMPMLAGVCGGLAGIALGIFHRNKYGRLFASLVGSLPALFFYSQNYDSYLTDGWEDSPIPMLVVSLIMIVSTVVAVLFTHYVFKTIKRRRAHVTALQEETKNPSSQGLIATGIATVMTIASLYYDLSFWRSLDGEGYSSEFFLIGTFLLALLAIAPSVYLLAAYRQRRLIGVGCGLAALIGFLLVLGRWYLRLIG